MWKLKVNFTFLFTKFQTVLRSEFTFQILGASYPAATAYYYMQKQDFNLFPGDCNDAITFRDVTDGQNAIVDDNKASVDRNVQKKVNKAVL